MTIHPLSDPEEVLWRREILASAMSQAQGITRVFKLAHTNAWPQLDLAKRVARAMKKSPPRSTIKYSDYLKKVVLPLIPSKTQYDDVFWSCLLHIASKSDIPGCHIGGPFHTYIYKVYDDFNPEDVLE